MFFSSAREVTKFVLNQKEINGKVVSKLHKCHLRNLQTGLRLRKIKFAILKYAVNYFWLSCKINHIHIKMSENCLKD